MYQRPNRDDFLGRVGDQQSPGQEGYMRFQGAARYQLPQGRQDLNAEPGSQQQQGSQKQGRWGSKRALMSNDILGAGLLFRAEGAFVRGVASGIGLASEAIHRRKEKSSQKEGDASEASEKDDGLYREVDEATWQLDEAQDRILEADADTPTTYRDRGGEESLAEVVDLLQLEPLPIPPNSESLSLPVVITQRRPGKRARGFVRAYAPILSDIGISEITFLSFMDNLNKAVVPNGLIQALNLASLAGLATPEPFTILISIAIQAATDVADAAHSRYKTNNFLDRMNKEFFVPRGVVAMIVTWKPGTPGVVAEVDFDSTATDACKPMAEQGKFEKFKRTFSQSSSQVAFEWPETAPLVFPILDHIAAAEGQEQANPPSSSEAKKENAVKRAGGFVGEYMDKRARAEWAAKHPDSKMAAEAGSKEKFHSRYADPNHPAASGDLIALLTGGNVQHPLAHLYKGSLTDVTKASGMTLGLAGAVTGAVRRMFEKVSFTS
ncbi:hypothetical protein F5Y18DRAFT_103027 [Xylariaceae sp. FL1019]|nr:hypothetical protein F5Y18DRAFT_103027 [Xylariaceae sp. FL1019]